jgi:hypothetical protein
LPVGKHTREVYVGWSLLLLWLLFFCEVHKIEWILAHRVCGFLNMQPPIKVKLNYFIKVWTWGHFS